MMRAYLALLVLTLSNWLSADNQTPTLSPVLTDRHLPFRVAIKKRDFELPMGVQSYIHATYDGKILLVTGRIGGLHGFTNESEDNFPIREQNTFVFVIDPVKKKTYTRSLLDPDSGLTTLQIDLLSVTAAQGYQKGKTLYITGGYGFNSATGNFDTKNALTAIDVPGLMHWVQKPYHCETAAEHIRQIFDDIFTVTGGYMNQTGDSPTLLIFGQQFDGFYTESSQDMPVYQNYTQQVRRFYINDDGTNLSITTLPPLPPSPDPNYRRRDLNVVPLIKRENNALVESFAALSGVFTPTTGIWTVPVEITANGFSSMADPDLPSTFKQGMNGYDCATFSLYSDKTDEMYVVLLGGMSYGYFEKAGHFLIFQTDDEVPFINQTTTIKIDCEGNYSQHLMKHGSYPYIASSTVNKGNELLFGSECEVILNEDIHKYPNEVLKLDCINEPTVIGHIVGGIASTMPNTNTQADSFQSKYIFEVIIEPK